VTEASATPAPGPAAAAEPAAPATMPGPASATGPDTTAAPAAGNGEVLLRAEHVMKYFPIRKGILLQREIARVHAVDDVSFELRAGETLGLVGESGCGKSTLARCIARLYPLTGGTVVFEGRDISRLTRRQLRPVRRDLQMVFQDPYASLNPRKRVGTVIADPLRIHKWGSRQQIKRRVGELLELVGLSPEHVNRYPHEFSGGQRQRIGVARALALHPRLIIADEPVSALDVSIRAQVINLLDDLQDELNLTYIFIAHDLGVVRHVSDRIAVMYLGKIVEISPAEELYQRPLHPYAEALLSAVPIPDPDLSEQRAQIVLEGDVPSPVAPVCHRDLHNAGAGTRRIRERGSPGGVPPPAQHRASVGTGCRFYFPAERLCPHGLVPAAGWLSDNPCPTAGSAAATASAAIRPPELVATCKRMGAVTLPDLSRNQEKTTPPAVVAATAAATPATARPRVLASPLARSAWRVGRMCHRPNTQLVTAMAVALGITRRSAACSTPRKAISSHSAVPTGIRTSA
jgi:ABC-type oligopeptide transport system ATPase subunit